MLDLAPTVASQMQMPFEQAHALMARHKYNPQREQDRNEAQEIYRSLGQDHLAGINR